MSNSPPTFGTRQDLHDNIAWDDPCSLHRKDDGGGLLYDMKALRRGPLAELVRHAMKMPAEERKAYVIEKPGDHRLDHAEIAELAAREDFPR